MLLTNAYTLKQAVAPLIPGQACCLAFSQKPLPCPQRVATTRRQVVVTRAQGEEADMSGEWPVNWSLASYEDVGEFFQNSLFKDSASPVTSLQNVMSTTLSVATPELTKEQALKLFAEVSGVPVVKSNGDWTLVGILSRKDVEKPGKTVADVMTTPPIAARPDNKVADAACLMLKHKVHRIPVVDGNAKVVGIVTRTDIFTALANEQASPDVKLAL